MKRSVLRCLNFLFNSLAHNLTTNLFFAIYFTRCLNKPKVLSKTHCCVAAFNRELLSKTEITLADTQYIRELNFTSGINLKPCTILQAELPAAPFPNN